MAPGGRQGDGGEDIDHQSAKHLLDSIGKKIHDKVKSEANQYKDELEGNLKEASGSGGELAAFPDTCNLVQEYYKHTNGGGNGDPCGNTTGKEDVDRFSVKQQAEYDNKKMKCSNGKNEGACAPFRRLHLCNKNMEKMGRTSTTKHDLLAEVCYAAKYEGQSIKTHYPKYDEQYPGSDFPMCTMLARSFADIGDIVRGRDLYGGGNNKRRQQLDDKLKEIFKKIHDDVTNGKKEVLKTRYKGDADKNYYKLREDWWTANRETVWEALTCEAPNNAQYFRQTCGDNENTTIRTPNQCRCTKSSGANAGKANDNVNIVPTYFDYVPQFLRWFEEWAEDFCRKKKKYVDIVKTYCRGKDKNDQERYCSRNGYDCEKTKRAIGKLRYACTVVDDNDGGRISFEKVNSGSASVPGGGTSGASGTNVESQGTFYRSKYCQPCPICGVKKTNNATTGKKWEEKDKIEECKNIKLYKPKKGATPTDNTILKSGDEEKDIAEKLEAFCEEKNGGTGSGSGGGSKSDSQELYDEWKCYEFKHLDKVGEGVDDDLEYDKEVKGAGGLCILENKNKTSDKEPKEIQKTFHNFFYYWVAHMLKDSIHWRTKKIKKCLENEKKKCGNKKCNNDCECFKRWIGKKEKEWQDIKKHFNKQEDIGQNVGPIVFSHYGVLEGVLELEFANENSEEDTQNNVSAEEAKEIRHLRDIIKKKKQEAGAGGSPGAEQKTLMDKLIEHEEGEAETCKKCKQPEEDKDLARKLDTKPDHVESEEEEDDDDEEVDGGEGDQETTENKDDVPATTEKTVPKGPQETTTPGVNPCEIVQKLFTNGDKKYLEEACKQKYSAPNRYWGWKCISDTTTKPGADSAPSGDKGGLCIPPRRRRLYVTPLSRWASGTTQESGEALKTSGTSSAGGEKSPVSGDSSLASTPATSSQSPSDPLLTAFVESAAIETFFLWDRYKKENTKTQGGAAGELYRQLVGSSGTLENSDEQTPEQQLQKGHIPPDFLRQMFYTLGDYRDILVRGGGDTNSGSEKEGGGSKENTNNDKTNIVLLASGSTEQEKAKMEKIQAKIESVLKESVNNKQVKHVKTDENSDNARVKWWNDNAKYIWKGMVCALTYEENGSDKPQVNDSLYNKFFGENNNDNPGKPGTPTGTYKETYDYKTVKLDNSGTEDPINNPKLSDFVEIPTFFRYLEEWGETFCRERRRRLAQIKVDCEVDDSGSGSRRGGKQKIQKYSGDGEACDRTDTSNGVFDDLEGRSCSISCSSYRKWIGRKKYEFTEQQNAFTKQKEKCQTQSNGAAPNNGGNGFCKTLERCSKAADFLNSLKNGPCKNESEENKKAEDEWTCEKVCGYVLCKPKNGNGQNDATYIIQIRALFKRWLEYFFEDYNRIQKKLKPCIENGNGYKCIKHCVDTWINQKRTEWNNINATYIQEYTRNNAGGNTLTNFLEQFEQRTEFKNAIKPCTKFDDFEKSKECAVAANSGSGNPEKKDIVECLFQKLEKKIEECKKKHTPSGENGGKSCTPLDNTTLEEEPIEEEEDPEENPVTQHPSFCNIEKKAETVEDKDACKAAASPAEPEQAAETPATSDDQSEKTPTIKPEKVLPSPEAPPADPLLFYF
ncbi:hypothetical protein PFTANZ_06696 [Plasmodium falciparum Tanzania (2000708)]|uniref:Duffy-binding-like domain-containing protein n=1 Tax=Plasmodium falciparum Tanzania (2000708) TaxID=1036725 RepID=A0A024VW81_PLAFA|nr:hypothetical protein PFTANZ_06696 [Plasmodium falciparum Tanzania (2000708)]